MKSIQTKITIVITVIMLLSTGAYMLTAMLRNKASLENDSNEILLSLANYYANVMDDNFRSTEQSVGSIYNYALKRAETYTAFLEDEAERDHYTNDISELGKSIAENTRGAMAVYLRYNPEDYGATSGFWYTIKLDDGSWQSSVPTDMSLYEPDDVEHVGWYYIPVSVGKPMWMAPYFNKNLGVEMISYIIPYYYNDYTVGIMGMDIDMSVLRESVSEISLYQSGGAFLITREGNLIYHVNYKEGMEYSKLPDEEKAYFDNILQLEKNTINRYTSITGEKQKLILKELRNGMILGVYASEKEISLPQRTLARQMVMIAVVIFVLSIAISLMWVKTIIRPLKKMTETAEHYANGDFEEEMSVGSNDEVGKLSRSLQTMSVSLKQQIEIANSANRAKSDFLANMSHEIRTPINAVLGMNEMILRESRDENVKNYAYDIHVAGQTLLSIINDILDMSKIESGKMEVIPVEYDMANVINDVIHMVTVRVEDKKLLFHTDIDESIPSRLYGDDVRIRQILFNLLTNAIKYTQEGSVTLTIRSEIVEDKAKLSFSVKDTGAGIAPENIDKLFLAFGRIDEKKNRNIEGTGLGLNIVAHLLKLMDSELKVDSEYGKGSDFYFTILQPIVDATPIGNIEEHYEERSRDYVHETKCIIPDVKVLIVDDNTMNRKVFIELLKEFACVIDQAESGMDCLAHINDKKYDVIFMDHMMPEMDGIETFHRIREMEGCVNAKTPVIILTANAVAGAKEKYLEEGFDNFLSKPIAPDKLESMLLSIVPDYKIFPYEEDDNAGEGEQAHLPVQVKSSAQTVPSAEELPDVEGADFVYALQKLKDVELLRSVIEDYCVMAGKDMRTLRELYQGIRAGEGSEEAFKAYRIKVHAMKSSAAMTGAVNASALARVLEYAARDCDLKTIDSVMDVFEREWLKMKESFEAAFDLVKEEPQDTKSELERTLLAEKLQTLSDAMDTLDTDIADAIIEELRQYRYTQKEEQIFQELAVSVRELDIKESHKWIKEWMNA